MPPALKDGEVDADEDMSPLRGAVTPVTAKMLSAGVAPPTEKINLTFLHRLNIFRYVFFVTVVSRQIITFSFISLIVNFLIPTGFYSLSNNMDMILT